MFEVNFLKKEENAFRMIKEENAFRMIKEGRENIYLSNAMS